ncbi:MAG TPA: ATP cone domain-containing protein [Bacteroidia bacterium]|jgi:Holliday junction resolvase|nr:ATP cone domain-containing protein [Bacteroidia bacterium]
MTKEDKVLVTKASGEVVPFSAQKLKRSLERVGAGGEESDKIISEVSTHLVDGITTKEIYRIAFNLLKKNSGHLAAKYHLKNAIMELGPSGFPFEKYISEILSHQGYKTNVGVVVQGQCVTHEIDIIAEQESNYFMIECKYHNQRGIFCDVKIPLYIQARFKDVESQWIKLPDHKNKFHQGWVVTNTRFSKDAIQYGNCAGLHLLGWNYPEKNGLRELIDRSGLYPITCLTTLSQTEKQFLLQRKIVLCKELIANENDLLEAQINPSRIKSIKEDVKRLCQSLNGKKITILKHRQNDE